MTLEEKTYKELCKQVVDRTNRPLTETQKEIIKATIEQARNPIELMSSIEALLIVWGGAKMQGILEFVKQHFDTIITVSITIIGFIVTYFMNKKSVLDELKKDKVMHTTELMETLPYDVCQFMNELLHNKSKTITKQSIDAHEKILSRIIAYGSADAVKLAIVVQKCAYEKERQTLQAGGDDGTRTLAAYALLITQLKFDLTSEVIPATSWFQIKIKDYEKIQNKTETAINALVDELGLNSKFKI